MKIISKAATHVGMVRELNEDSFLDSTDNGTWAVADGMGGHESGEVASQAVVEVLGRMAQEDSFQDSLDKLQKLVLQANDELVNDSERFSRDRQPGSTVVALLLQEGEGAAVWAGDSRIYRRRFGTFEQLTRDHSHVQELLDNDLIRPDEAERHPMANVITRAVGIDVPLDIDTRVFEVLDGDQFLLCSDGLTRLVADEEINEMMNNSDEEEIVQSLLHTALVRGAPDNVTIVYVACGDVDDGSTVVMSIDDLI